MNADARRSDKILSASICVHLWLKIPLSRRELRAMIRLSEHATERGYLVAGAPPDCAGMGGHVGGACRGQTASWRLYQHDPSPCLQRRFTGRPQDLPASRRSHLSARSVSAE